MEPRRNSILRYLESPVNRSNHCKMTMFVEENKKAKESLKFTMVLHLFLRNGKTDVFKNLLKPCLQSQALNPKMQEHA